MQQAIFSIGQGARTVEDLIDAIARRNIQYLCDVRSVPISNYAPEFCRVELEDSLSKAGIKYVAMGRTLGGRPDDRSAYNEDGRVDYDKLVLTDFFKRGIEQLLRGARTGHSLAVFCSEGQPERCHRSKAIGRALQELGATVTHIDANDQDISQDLVLTRIGLQMPLLEGFADLRRFSRGRWT